MNGQEQRSRAPVDAVYRSVWLPLGLLAISGLALLGLFELSSHAMRALATALVVLGPGCAVVPLLRVREPALAAALVLLISIATLVCAAQATTYIASFSWRPCVAILSVVTLLGIAAQLILAVRDHPTT